MNKKIFLKLVISGSLFSWLLIYKVDWYALEDILASLNLVWLSISFIMHFSGLLLSSWRWKKLLECQKIHIKLPDLIQSYLICSFFNLFMPTRVGGDAVRIHHLNQGIKSISKSASSIIFERIMGIFVLCIMASVSSAYSILIMKDEIHVVWIGLLFGVIGVFVCLSVIYFNPLGIILSLFPNGIMKERALKAWENFIVSVRQMATEPKCVLWGVGISFLLQVNVIVHFWFIGKALHLQVPLHDYFFLIPIQMIVLMLPSINGIGLRELSCITLFNFYGINATASAMFGFIDLIMMIMIGMIGWLVFLRNKKVIPDSN